MLFCSISIQLSRLKHLLSGFRLQNMERGIMTIRVSVWLLKIYHRFFWEFRAYNKEVAKLADMVREVVQVRHLHKVEFRIVHKMLCNFWIELHFIFIVMTTLCSCSRIVPSGVTLLLLLFVQRKLLVQRFRDLLCRFTGEVLTENIPLMLKLLQIMLHGLDCGLSMVLALCHKVKIHKVLDTQQGFCEGSPLAHQRV